jgi:hypothetical protein
VAIGSYAGANAAPSNSLIVSGNVGIGTTAPGVNLDVEGNPGGPATSGTTQTGVFRIGTGSTGNSIDFGQISAGPYSMWIQGTHPANLSVLIPLALNPNGGNVGIGTTAPAALLSVGSSSQFQVNSTGVSSAGAGSTDLNGSGVPEAHCLADGTGCPSAVTQTIPASTVSGLSVDVPTGALALVTNGITATDCTIGGGTIDVLCRFSGSAWVAYSTFVNAPYVPTNHFTSNSFGVCYTNRTGLLIHLHITTISSPADTTTLFEGSCPTPSTVAAAQSQVGGSGELSGDIPNGVSYYVTNDGSGTLVTWLEVY